MWPSKISNPPPPPPQKKLEGALKITDLGTTPSLRGRMYYLSKFEAYLKRWDPNFNDGTPIIFKVESQGPPNIQLGVKPWVILNCVLAKTIAYFHIFYATFFFL